MALGISLAVAALAALALAVSVWLRTPAEPATLLRVTGLVAAGVLLALLAWLSRRSARRQKARTEQALSWIETLHVCGSRPARPQASSAAPEPAAGGGATSLELRVLRQQVRSLEAALEQQHLLVEDAHRAADERVAETRQRDRERALMTVRALRDVLAGQPGIVAMNRLEAALARLGAEDAFVRPALAETPAGTPVVVLHAPQTTTPAGQAVAGPAAAPAAEPAVAASVPEDLADEPAPSADVPQAVLPVPASALPSASHRSRRRRLRRTVAA